MQGTHVPLSRKKPSAGRYALILRGPYAILDVADRMAGGRMGLTVLPITGVVLAGGAGRRMGGVDKGFVLWSGEPLVVHALRRVSTLPQVLISANRSLARYRALGHEVVVDDAAPFGGPLMGLRAAFLRASYPWVMSIPVDSPSLPLDISARLWASRVAEGIVVARSPRGVEPLVFLAARSLFSRLEAYCQTEGRRAQEWFIGAPQSWLDLTPAEAFNCNTPDDVG